MASTVTSAVYSAILFALVFAVTGAIVLIHPSPAAMAAFVALQLIFGVSLVVSHQSTERRRRALQALAAELGQNPAVSMGTTFGGTSVRFERDGTTFEGQAFVSRYTSECRVRFDVPTGGEKLVIQSKFFLNQLVGELPDDCQRVAGHAHLEDLHLLGQNPAFLSSLLANENLVWDLAQYGYHRCGIIRVALTDGRVEICWCARRPAHEDTFAQLFETAFLLHDGLLAAAKRREAIAAPLRAS
jgi:hypothetical protein